MVSRARDFGAAGDGMTDDTEALQHALDHGDGVLDLDVGTYRIRTPLTWRPGVSGPGGVQGASGAARLVMDGPGPALRIRGSHRGTADPGSVRPTTWRHERMPQIAGLEIVGNHPEADGLELALTWQAVLRDLLVRECRFGIRLVERNRNTIIASCHVYHCRDTGIFLDRCNLHQLIISGCHVSYCGRAGIRQQDGDVHNIQITGNDIEYNAGGEPASGEIVLVAPDGIISEYTIASNTLQARTENPGANVWIEGRPESPPASVRLVAVTGNVLGSRAVNVYARHASRMTIQGNTIYGGRDRNLHLKDCAHVAVTGNTLVSRPANYAADTRDGILLERCQACQLHSNLLNDCRHGDASQDGSVVLRACRDCTLQALTLLQTRVRGIDVVESNDCRISECSVRGDDTDSLIEGIRIADDCRGILVTGNDVQEGTRGDIVCPPSCGTSTANHSRKRVT